jgi:hypothetical protein
MNQKKQDRSAANETDPDYCFAASQSTQHLGIGKAPGNGVSQQLSWPTADYEGGAL